MCCDIKNFYVWNTQYRDIEALIVQIFAHHNIITSFSLFLTMSVSNCMHMQRDETKICIRIHCLRSYKLLNAIIRCLMSNYHALSQYAPYVQSCLTYKGDEIIIKVLLRRSFQEINRYHRAHLGQQPILAANFPKQSRLRLKAQHFKVDAGFVFGFTDCY